MLEIKNICKSYKKNNILNNISFCVDEGEIVCIVGANGCGKSTLAEIIANNSKPDSGKIIIDGQDMLTPSFDTSKYIGYVPQENILFNKLSAAENIDFWAKAYKKKYNPIYFDKNSLGKKVSKLSGGYKKILSIELALINNPKYLIMDEPTSSLDLVNQQKIMDLILDYKSRNNSVLIVTHHLNEMKQCDKIFVIQNKIISIFNKDDNIFDNNKKIIDLIQNNI